MCYGIDPERSGYDVLKYEEEKSVSYEYFLEGPRKDDVSVAFTVKNKQFLKWAPSIHIFNTLGPVLVSSKFKKVIEATAPGEVDFYSAIIMSDENIIHGFYAIRPKTLASCYDLKRSEYDESPSWLSESDLNFTYIVLVDQVPYGLNIVRCEESPSIIVVGDTIKEACYKSKLKGLIFWRTKDRTPKGRDICEKIK